MKWRLRVEMRCHRDEERSTVGKSWGSGRDSTPSLEVRRLRVGRC